MAHPKLQLSRLLDWLKLRIECEDTSPTDEQIAAFLGLDSERTAMSMLADLADRGDITIRGSGAARQIALGRQHRAIETPRPVPSVIRPPKPMLSEEECVRRIQMITGRKPVQPDSPAAELEAPASGEGERLEVSDLRAPAPSVPIAAPQFTTPALPDEVISQLSEMGRDAGLRVAKRVIAAGKYSEPSAANTPTPLFRIPAEVTRAAIKHDMPVLDFAATLMMRGLGSFEQDAARERAA